jgi:hypothetical protein
MKQLIEKDETLLTKIKDAYIKCRNMWPAMTEVQKAHFNHFGTIPNDNETSEFVLSLANKYGWR